METAAFILDHKRSYQGRPDIFWETLQWPYEIPGGFWGVQVRTVSATKTSEKAAELEMVYS